MSSIQRTVSLVEYTMTDTSIGLELKLSNIIFDDDQ